MLSVKSAFTIFHILPSEAGFRNGILMNISITADKTKHTIHTNNTSFIPYALYRIPPSTGPLKDANELMVLMIEFAAIRFPCSTSAGILACTDGW